MEQSKGGVWVKASERMPRIKNWYILRFGKNKDWVTRTLYNPDVDTEERFNHATGVDLINIEWLDESITPQSDAVEDWISVEERLPESDNVVLVYLKDPYPPAPHIIMSFYKKGYGWAGKKGDVTHWQPLPLPPKH